MLAVLTVQSGSQEPRVLMEPVRVVSVTGAGFSFYFLSVVMWLTAPVPDRMAQDALFFSALLLVALSPTTGTLEVATV